jgi:hypothetical protein
LSYSPLPKPPSQSLTPSCRPCSKPRPIAAAPAQASRPTAPTPLKVLLHRYRPCSKPYSIAAAPAQRSIVFRQLFFVGLFLPVSLLQFVCFISFQFFVPLPELCFFNFVEDYCLYLPPFDTGRLNLVGHFYLCIDSHYGHFYLVPLGFVFDFGIWNISINLGVNFPPLRFSFGSKKKF